MNINVNSIESVILSDDRRGISEISHHLNSDFCSSAATLTLNHQGHVLITTGFYIASAQAAETDGPPGALAIGNALQRLGFTVAYVSDLHLSPLLSEYAGENSKVIDFPITNHSYSRTFAAELISQEAPDLLISVERCGPTANDTYLNMRGVDISNHTARIDSIFQFGIPSIGIGDGGNEIGMGSLAHTIPNVQTLPPEPCVTKTNEIILASVSNWGAYGLVAALSNQVGEKLLPSLTSERQLIKSLVQRGLVDGTNGHSSYKVDGFTLDDNAQILAALAEFS
ncbi:MAG: hypothetical protein CL886_09870 [Dehalococcoidia bacterium]|nr:hypothetical protein [Dehalococcoidia bacterium]|tara:strand:- start:17258 stop:18106 length:849 start_codon:yes stop_codon:yes gene_type:complete